MIIDILTIKQVTGGKLSVALVMAAADATKRSEFQFHSDPNFSGEVENLGHRFKVTGEVTAELVFPCDRCGETVIVPVTAELEEYFGTAKDSYDSDSELDEEIHALTGDTIDLFPYVDQALFLARPMKILCRDDCWGLCPQCGQNLNQKKCNCSTQIIDPRLEALVELLHNDDKHNI